MTRAAGDGGEADDCDDEDIRNVSYQLQSLSSTCQFSFLFHSYSFGAKGKWKRKKMKKNKRFDVKWHRVCSPFSDALSLRHFVVARRERKSIRPSITFMSTFFLLSLFVTFRSARRCPASSSQRHRLFRSPSECAHVQHARKCANHLARPMPTLPAGYKLIYLNTQSESESVRTCVRRLHQQSGGSARTKRNRKNCRFLFLSYFWPNNQI